VHEFYSDKYPSGNAISYFGLSLLEGLHPIQLNNL